jgi:hypothetical protein
MPPISLQQLAAGLRQNCLRAIDLLFALDLSGDPSESSGSADAMNSSLRFLNYPLHTESVDAIAATARYKIGGWYYRSGNEWVEISVTRADGSAANAQIERKRSPDIANHFHDDLASLQRYAINVECNGHCVLRAQAPDGSHIEKAFADLAKAPLGIAIGPGTLYVDGADSGDDAQYKLTRADEVARRIRHAVVEDYKYPFLPMLVLGVIAFAASTLLYRRAALGNVCYVIALVAWMLAVTRATLLLLITATSFNALHVLYMAPAYFMLVAGAMFSCASWLQLSRAPSLSSSDLSHAHSAGKP